MSGLAAFKAAFARRPGLVHLNNAGLAPIPAPAREAIEHWARRFMEEGFHCNDDYLAAQERARASLARLVGCGADSIAFFQSTAWAVSQVAFGLRLKPGDEVVMWDQEYGSNLHPWREACKRAGAKLVLVESGPDLSTPAERLLAAATPRTRALAFSWVQYQTGAITDLKAVADFARARGIWTVVDAIQGVGARPLDMTALGLDAVCGGSHKWLASPVGVGYLAVRPERLEELAPLAVGAGTFGTCDDPVSLVCAPKPGAGRLEPGARQTLDILALGASVDLLLAAGPDEIARESGRLARRLREGLRAKGWTLHSPEEGAIVAFSRPGGVEAAAAALKQAGVAFAVRGPGLRLSPHAFNSDEDADGALACL